jgi:hypothetical protein
MVSTVAAADGELSTAGITCWGCCMLWRMMFAASSLGMLELQGDMHHAGQAIAAQHD